MGNTVEGLLLGRPVLFTTDKDGRASLASGMRMPAAGTQIAGQVTGTLVNTFIKGPDVYSPDGFIVGGHPSNTSYVLYSSISGTNGMPVSAGNSNYVPVDNLNQLYLSVAVSGEKIVWAMV